MGVRLVLHCAATSTSGRKSPGRKRQLRIQLLRSRYTRSTSLPFFGLRRVLLVDMFDHHFSTKTTPSLPTQGRKLRTPKVRWPVAKCLGRVGLFEMSLCCFRFFILEQRTGETSRGTIPARKSLHRFCVQMVRRLIPLREQENRRGGF